MECEHSCHDGEHICSGDLDRCCSRPGVPRKEMRGDLHDLKELDSDGMDADFLDDGELDD